MLHTTTDPDNEKLSGYPHSTLGSLSSIITTSIASSEPDPGAAGGGSGGGGGGGSGGAPGSVAADAGSIAGVNGSSEEKLALNRPGIKQEKWTTILLQVSIPFFLAGIGTIGAGIVLGRVEVMYIHIYIPYVPNSICSINHWSRARALADTANENGALMGSVPFVEPRVERRRTVLYRTQRKRG